jgi:hypothetical protein
VVAALMYFFLFTAEGHALSPQAVFARELLPSYSADE